MWNFFKARFQEGSTWRGLIAILTAAGVGISPALADSIIATGLAVMGTVGVFTKERKGD